MPILNAHLVTDAEFAERVRAVRTAIKNFMEERNDEPILNVNALMHLACASACALGLPIEAMHALLDSLCEIQEVSAPRGVA